MIRENPSITPIFLFAQTRHRSRSKQHPVVHVLSFVRGRWGSDQASTRNRALRCNGFQRDTYNERLTGDIKINAIISGGGYG